MVNMDGGIDANEPLDYIEFQIFPGQSRYEASICLGKNSEVAASGSLEPLLLHSLQIKALHSKGSDSRFKLAAPEDGNGARWFMKSTLLRFLQIVSSPEVLKATTAMRSEIFQLEEAHSFQLSLYGKGSQKHFAREDADLTYHESETNGFPKDGTDAVTSDDSKNELLRAMHLRLATLRVELSNAFAKAATMTSSKEEINDIAKFCSLIGATDLRKSFCYLVELSEENCAEINMRSGIICEAEDKNQVSKQSNLPVRYGCSPAKVAEIERQNSSESGESSDSSMNDQPSMERSRTLIRSASPRRSASPMRRVQIGKSGSRRSTPLTIKSLNYFPRERLVLQNDEAEQNKAEEEAQQPSKKSESNTGRTISVQDAISLFESKRRDETSGIQKTNSFSTASIGPNKSVLRRWSTGIGGASNACQDSGSDSSVELPPSNMRTIDSRESSSEGKREHDPSSIGHDVEPAEHGPSSIDHDVEPAEVDAKPDCPQQSDSNLGLCEENDTNSQSLCSKEKKNASAEWSRQKEAELDQLLMKMMETKPVKYKSALHHNGKINEVLGEKKGGLFDRNKEKKNEKFQNKNARKVADKEKQLRSVQLVPDKRNSGMDSIKPNHGGNKHNMDAKKSKKTTSSSSDSAKEILKSSVSRKASSKTPLPATRKSWPSAPTTRSTGISPAKTPPEMVSAGTTTRRKSQPPPPSVTGSSPKMLTSPVLASAGTTTTTRRKSQPVSPVTGSIPKMLTSQLKTNSLKAVRNDKSKTVKDVNAKNQQPLKKNPISTKSKNVDADSTLSGKPSLYSKVTKKSSVVPLEPKPFLRKGSKVGAAVTSISMTKGSSEADESSKDSKDQILPGGNEIVSASSDMVISQQELDLELLKDYAISEQDVESRSLDNSLDSISQVAVVEDYTFQEVAAVSSSPEALDKPTISLTAWVDIDEHEDQTVNDNICQVELSPNITPTSIPSPRIRYSLSQMLLEETSEPDINEWGNADNPPTMVYQKDAPKGLKKLLKFARKSKTDANSTGWSSPSVFSEGEDDAEESRSVGKRSSDNLLKMATLQAKNYGNQKASFQEKTSSTHGLFGRSNINKATPRSISGNVQDSPNSGSNSHTKATRPFFSLSAFRGSK